MYLKKVLKRAIKTNCCQDIRAFQAECYKELFDKIVKMVKNYFPIKAKAEDVTQGIFLKIFERDIKKLEPHLEYIDRYLCKIADNHCKNSCKKKRYFTELDKALPIEVNSPSIENQIDLEKYMSVIPATQSTAIKQQMKGYTIKEIALEMNKSVGVVKTDI